MPLSTPTIPRPRTTTEPSPPAAPSPPTASVSTTPAPAIPAPREAPTYGTAVPADGLPVPTFPRRIPGRAPDGRRWDLLTSSAGVVAVGSAGTIAEAAVSERGDEVVVSFWVGTPGRRRELCTQLVRQAFCHPAIRARRPVLVSVPRGDYELLAPVRRHVRSASTRVAGVTCLIEGLVTPAPRAMA